MCKRSKNGFGLIETMTALGISAIVLLAASQVADYVNTQVQKTVSINSQLQLESIVKEKTSFPDLCSAAIGSGAYPGSTTTNPNPVTLSPSDPSWQGNNAGKDVVLYTPGLKAGIDLSKNTISDISSRGDNVLPLLGVKIYSLKVENGYQVPNAIVPTGEVQYVAKLVMQVGPLSTGTGAGATQISPPVVLSTMTLDMTASGTVVDCRGGVASSQQQVCQDFGCTYDATKNPPCTCPPYSRGCSDPFEIPVGVDKSGVFICALPGGNGTCPTGYYLSGIAGQKVVCTSYVPSSTTTASVSCPALADAETWTVSGNTCTGNLSTPTEPIGSTVAVTSTTPVGSETFTCSSTGQWQVASSPAPTCAGSSGLTCTLQGPGGAGAGNFVTCKATQYGGVSNYGCTWIGSSSSASDVTCTGSSVVPISVPAGCTTYVGVCPTSGSPSLSSGQYCSNYINDGFVGDAGCGGTVYENGDQIGAAWECCVPP